MTTPGHGQPDRPRIADISLAVLYAAIFLGYTAIVLGRNVLALPWLERASPGLPGFEPSVLLLSRAAIIFVVVCSVALAWRRSRPELAFLVIGGIGALQFVVGEPIRLWDIALPVGLFSAAAYASRTFARLALALAVLGYVGIWAIGVNLLGRIDELPSLVEALAGPRGATFAVIFALLVLVWAIGDQVRAARERLELELERAASVVREQETTARLGALAERQRIARDLHDVVAHGLSVIIVQADGALYAEAEHPDAPRRALETIASAGRQSLDDMRQILGVLREGPEAAEGASQPELASLPALLEQFRAAGLDVAYGEDGTVRAVPPAVGLTAYRVVQESLTNVLHHAGITHVDVHVGYRPDGIELDIQNVAGTGTPRPATGGTGLGLVGMRERVNLLGGQLTVGPTPEGGFRVHVEIPTKRADVQA
ncbi:MAG TPA: histidine kinase [Candidatus Limnocylindrales bacterium]|nr:histidine kinase [Candidatus Limnocylindrales bacterium]